MQGDELRPRFDSGIIVGMAMGLCKYLSMKLVANGYKVVLGKKMIQEFVQTISKF